ncbi:MULTISPECIES: cation diffusion facilitator family transporter [Legionella]|uniref:Cation efflux family protein n=1 Tax=Legionella drozanskii LLAP-1 TaxID=1212489 RepID=A0A0W0SVU2_9GAMM|nr:MULTISPECIES: cation diffusion facilitator family transporter [Legionella]KTC87514.1 cation efflux family protein [Legionella drozanskii LLAP-1]PJE10452.1 MAG: cation transporter [Legionella sp.]
MTQKERYLQAKKITLIGATITALLGLIKVMGGFFFHSHALIADGVHSFSDLLTDCMVVFASKYGSQDADESHPYGHQRIETAATLLLAVLLILAGAGIAWDSLDELIHSAVEKPGWFALPIALLSIAANEGLFHYTHHVGLRIQSPLIIANAWHHRSDAASSIVVAIGLLGSILGFSYLDALAAVIVGCMIIKMGMSYGWNSVKELVDSAVEPQMLEKIIHIIQAVDGVEKIHQLRSRSMGGDIYIDVHILVNPYISVSEGHYIAQHVDKALVEQLDAVKDVTVHVDPEDDELNCPSLHLQNRTTVQEGLFLAWKRDFPELQTWTLHYLDGKMLIDLECAKNFKQWQTLRERIQYDLKSHNDIQQVRLMCPQEVIVDETA